MKVLVVDDEKDIVEIVADCLRDHGCEAYEAFSVGDCFELLSQHTFDVIITDLNMPVQNGLILIKRIQSLKLPTDVYLLTASDSVNPQIAKNYGFRGLFRKPFKVENIFNVIKNKSEYFSEL